MRAKHKVMINGEFRLGEFHPHSQGLFYTEDGKLWFLFNDNITVGRRPNGKKIETKHSAWIPFHEVDEYKRRINMKHQLKTA